MIASVWQSYVSFAVYVQKNPKVAMTIINMAWHNRYTNAANLRNALLDEALLLELHRIEYSSAGVALHLTMNLFFCR